MRAAANNSQQQQQQQQQQPQQRDFNDEPFDVTSRKLSVSDLVRVRTLGTGRPALHSPKSAQQLTLCSGTFARVCLVRPSHGTEADRSKVYALKMLRKTEGERCSQDR
jgi:protein kinase A